MIARRTVEEYKLVVDNVLDAAFRRDTIKRLKECMKLVMDPESTDLERQIYAALDGVMMEFSTNNEVPEYAEVVDGYWEEIKNRQGAGYAGIPFKFPTLNEYVTIEPGELIIDQCLQRADVDTADGLGHVPVKQGEELGAIIYSINGKEIGRVALVAESDIKEATYLDYLKKILNYF